MTTLETLKAARAKIANRKNWTTGHYARDAKSRPVPSADPTACRWCAQGAILSSRSRQAHAALVALTGASYPFTSDQFNDTHTHTEVLALFDKAIAEAQ